MKTQLLVMEEGPMDESTKQARGRAARYGSAHDADAPSQGPERGRQSRPQASQKQPPQSGPDARPLDAYTYIMIAFGTAHLLASIFGRRLTHLTALDAVLLCLSTFRVGRVVAQDVVTSSIRAPFVAMTAEPKGDGRAKIEEQPTGHGLRVAMGQLLTCPSCSGLWGAALQVWGLMMLPFLFRPFIWIMAASGANELLQLLTSRLSAPPTESARSDR